MTEKFASKYKAFRKTFRTAQLGYCDPKLKQSFHNRGMRLLRLLAEEIGLVTADYDTRSNKGGIAVSGEVWLQSESLYVQLNQSPIVFHGTNNQGNIGFMVRFVTGRAVGARSGRNHFHRLSDDPVLLVNLCKQVIADKARGEAPF